MAKKKEVAKEYLYGTFSGNGTITIDANTPTKAIEVFLKNNPKVADRITNPELIKNQKALMSK